MIYAKELFSCILGMDDFEEDSEEKGKKFFYFVHMLDTWCLVLNEA